jgi:hypothetical protein
MKDFPQCFKSARQDSFRAKLRNIGKPKQIRLKLEITGHDTEEIKWHLDHVNTLQQKNTSFTCFFPDRCDRSRNPGSLQISL